MPADPTEYPRTYHISTGFRLLGTVMGLVFLIAAVVLAWQLARHDFTIAGTTAGAAVGLLVCGAFGAYCIAGVVKSRIVLTADRITVPGILFHTQSLRRDEIAGRRVMYSDEGVKNTFLIPIRPDLTRVRIEDGYATDAVFDTWMASIPILNPKRVQPEEEAIVSDPAFGPTRDARLAKLKSARRLVSAAQVAACAVAFLPLFIAAPPAILLVIGAALPWAMLWLVRTSRGLYRLDFERDHFAYVDVTVVLVFPGIGLLVAAAKGMDLVRWQESIPAAATVVAAIFLASLWAEPGLRKLSTSGVTLLIALVPYGIGVAMLADVHLDRSMPQVVPTVVQYGIHDTPRGAAFGPYLTLMPLGARGEGAQVPVGQAFYSSVKRGDTLCAILHAGALGAPWYSVEKCR